MNLINKIRLLSKICNLPNLKGEDALANQIAMVLTGYTLDNQLKGVWFHVPNESVVSKENKLKDILRIQRKHCMGLINGVPDFVFISKEKSLFIEVKTDKGRLSESQVYFRDWSIDEKIDYYIARSVEEVKDILIRNKLLTI